MRKIVNKNTHNFYDLKIIANAEVIMTWSEKANLNIAKASGFPSKSFKIIVLAIELIKFSVTPANPIEKNSTIYDFSI